MRTLNPSTKVPFLELDDGSCIGETIAICRYFEELGQGPSLMGENPKEKAAIEMWQRQIEFYFLLQVGMCFQHSTGYFKDRMRPVAEYGRVAGENALDFLPLLEQQLADKTYICGDKFSIADITLLCAVDFARVVDIRLSDEHPNLQRWHQLVSSRESAKA